MPSNTSTVGALLHEEVEPGIVNQLNNETPLLDSFENTTDTAILGNYKVRGIQVNRNRGGMYTAEGGPIPVAGSVEIQRLMIPERFYHAPLSFTEQVLNATRSAEGAFADVFRLGVDDLQEGLRIRRNQMLWGDGRGVLALVNGGAAAVTQTLDSPGGIAGADDGVRFLNVGDWIGFVIPGGGLRVATAHEVTGIPTANTVTLNPTVTTIDNDFVVKAVQTAGVLTIGGTEYMKAIMGVGGIVDNSAAVNIYFGLSRTTFNVLNSTVITGVGALSADVIQRAIDVAHKVGGARINELWVESAVKRAFIRLAEVDRRYIASDLRSPDVGTAAAKPASYKETGLRFGTIPIYQDPFCPYGQMIGLDTRSLKRYPGPMGWLDRDGNTLHLSTTQVDTWDAWFRCFEQFAGEKPNQMFKLTGITCDVVVAHVI